MPSHNVGSNAPCNIHSGDPQEVAVVTNRSSSLSVAPFNEARIILANPWRFLKALDEEKLAEGGAGNDDTNIFRNLPIIEDVEMSLDSSKRKRNYGGECSSCP